MPQQPQPNQKAKLKEATKNLAKLVEQVVQETSQELNKLNRMLEQTNEVVGAIVRLLGQESVENSLEEMREEAKANLLDQQKKSVQYLIDNKVLVETPEVTAPDGYVVGTDKFPDGTAKRVQFEVAGINQQFLPLYLGKKVGDTIEGNGAVLTIDEIYAIDRAQFDKVMAEQGQQQSVSAPTATPEAAAEATPAAQEQ